MIDRVIEWIRRTPRRVVAPVLVYVVVLIFVGAASHITDLIRGGLRPYPWAPGWLNAVYGIQHSGFLAQPGPQRLTAFALFLCATGPFVRPRLSRDRVWRARRR